MMRRQLTHSKYTNLIRAVGRLVLISSTAGVVSLVANWSNYHSYRKVEMTPQQGSILSLKPHQSLEKSNLNQDQYLLSLPSNFVQNYLQWLKSPWQWQGLPGTYLSTTILFMASGMAVWTVIEIIVYQKLSQQQKLHQTINYFKSQISQNNLQKKKRNQALHQLKNKLSPRDTSTNISQPKNIHSLASSLVDSLPLYPKQTNHIQKIQQDIHQTQQQAYQAKNRAESLKKILISLAINTEYIHNQIKIDQGLETELTIVTKELKNAKELEKYLIEEYHLLEIENQNLSRDLRLAQQKIRYLSYLAEEQEDQINQGNQDNDAQDENSALMIVLSATARENLTKIYHLDKNKYAKVIKALRLMRENLRHPSLHTHEYHSLTAPNDQKVFESYVENRTPSAWRIFWYYGPGNCFLTIHSITQHPE